MESCGKKVTISLYASKLKNVAGLFKGTSDPFAIVSILPNDPSQQPFILGKTEVIKNSLSPRWTTTFTTEFDFATPTRIHVSVFDEVKKSKNIPMGSATFELGNVLAAKGNARARKVSKKDGSGTLYCRVMPSPKDLGVLKLTLQARNLLNVDGMFGKSDPFFEVLAHLQDSSGLTWHPVYRSEHIDNNLNPNWKPAILPVSTLCQGISNPRTTIEYENVPIRIRIYDWEKSGKHEVLGAVETNLNGLKCAHVLGPFDLVRKGKTKAKYGQLIVAEATVTGGPSSTAYGSSSGSDGGGPTGKYDPVASKSATTDANGVPKKFIRINGVLKKNPDYQKYMDAKKAGSAPPPAILEPDVYGASAPRAAMTPNPLASRPTFVDYISGACEMQMNVAIDFTASNGDPRQPASLHYIDPEGLLNHYEKAITAVCEAVARYDSDQHFPVYGFGAKFHGQIDNCFQVGHKSEVKGIRGIVEAYRKTFSSGLVMSGPTHFQQVITKVAALARIREDHYSRYKGKQAYSILLILTDGAVSDVQETKQAIREASDAPLSIIIIGIGNEDFGDMHLLDDFHEGSERTRDICQFVQFSKYEHDRVGLVKDTLAEVPDQLVNYFYGKGIMPLQPLGVSGEDVEDHVHHHEKVELNFKFSGDDMEIDLANFKAPTLDESKYSTK